MRKLSLAVLAWGLLAALSAQGAPEDGTFVINITGPNAEQEAAAAPSSAEIPAAAPRRTLAPQPVRQTTSANAPATPSDPIGESQRYTVQRNDTIWSIANRFLPNDGSVNEFQTVAAIYRANPQAFSNGDINRLRRTVLTIPPTATIAQENQQTGIDLLNGSLHTLPPLTEVAAQQPAAVPEATLPQSTVQAQSANEVLPSSLPPREYVARETRIREGDGRLENTSTISESLPAAEASRPDEYYSDNDGSHRDSEGATVTAENDPLAQGLNTSTVPVSEDDINFAAVRELIDSTRKSLEIYDQQIDKRLAEAISQSETTAKSAAQTAAHDEVFSIMNRYEGIISDLQQSNAELRANIAKLSKQIDQVRQMSLDSADELEFVKQNLSLEQSGSSDIVPQGPLMWILLGIGMMTLILALTLFIFKRKMRTHAQTQSDEDFGFDDDLTSTELLSSSVIGLEPPVAEQSASEAVAEQKEETPEVQEGSSTQATAQASATANEEAASQVHSEPETSSAPEGVKVAAQTQRTGGVSIQSGTDNAFKAGAGVEVAAVAKKDTAETSADVAANGTEFAAVKDRQVDEVKIPADMMDASVATSGDKLAAAWKEVKDKPVNRGGLDDWAAQQAAKEQDADLKLDLQDTPAKSSSDEELAAQWDEALKKQAKSDAAAAEPKAKNTSADEELAAQWEAALKEQSKADAADAEPETRNLSADEELAAQWEAALKEQSKGDAAAAKPETKTPSADEELAAQWAAALKEQAKGDAAAADTEIKIPSADAQLTEQRAVPLDEQSLPKTEAPSAEDSRAVGAYETEAEPEEVNAFSGLTAAASAVAADSLEAKQLAAKFGAAVDIEAPPAPLAQQQALSALDIAVQEHDTDSSQEDADALLSSMKASATNPSASSTVDKEYPQPALPEDAPTTQNEGVLHDILDIKPDDPLFSVYDAFLNGKTVDDNLKRSSAYAQQDYPKNETRAVETTLDMPESAAATSRAEFITPVSTSTPEKGDATSAIAPEPAAPERSLKDCVTTVEDGLVASTVTAEPDEAATDTSTFSWTVPEEDGFDITSATGISRTSDAVLEKTPDDAALQHMLQPSTQAPTLSSAKTDDFLGSGLSAEHLVKMMQPLPSAPPEPEKLDNPLLNLALLYFEAGSMDKAQQIIAEIKAQGDPALSVRADILEERYAQRR